MPENPGAFNRKAARMDETTVFRILATVLGLVLGSFYNVCIHRGLTGESIANPPRSKCPKCGHFLSWWENIPLVSWLLLRGRCRSCRKPISARYPLVEALSGAVALALAVKFGPGMTFAVYLAFSGLLIVLAFIDLASFMLPLWPMIIGAVLAMVCAPLFLGIPLLDALLAAGVGAGTFWLVRWAYRRLRGIEGLGEGDIWLMLLLGPLTGLRHLPFVILASGVSLIAFNLPMLLRQGHRDAQGNPMQTPIPYGPFLCLAAMLAILVGDDVLAWYLGTVR